MNRPILRIGKVGGSLFDDDQLPATLRNWLAAEPGINVLLAGGGALADFVRVADRRFHLGEAASHALCLRAMTLTAEMLTKLLPHAQFCRDAEALHHVIAQQPAATIVVDAAGLLQPVAGLAPLPERWSVTSDSIAAHLAGRFAADELVLFKSLDLPHRMTRYQAAAAGLVDPYFPTVSVGIPLVRWINLRGHPGSEQHLTVS